MGCVQSSQEIEAGNGASNNSRQQPAAQSGNQQYRGRQLNGNAGGSSNRRQAAAATQAATNARIQYLQNQNVETIVPGKFSGEGIKKTPAYETPLSKHELDKWRKDFWDTRTSGSKQIWNCIRSACEEGYETAEALILAADLQMPQNSLTLCIDETGVYYRVPICLINDPIGFDADFQTQKLKSKVEPDQKQMTLKIRHAARGDVILEISNKMSISDFKKEYVAQLKDDTPDVGNIRLFAMGKELKDELWIYSYDMMNESTVQAMIKK